MRTRNVLFTSLAVIFMAGSAAFAAQCGDAPLTQAILQSRGPVMFLGQIRYGIFTPGWDGHCRRNGFMFHYYAQSHGVEFFECVGGQVKYDFNPEGVQCQ